MDNEFAGCVIISWPNKQDESGVRYAPYWSDVRYFKLNGQEITSIRPDTVKLYSAGGVGIQLEAEVVAATDEEIARAYRYPQTSNDVLVVVNRYTVTEMLIGEEPGPRNYVLMTDAPSVDTVAGPQ
jgi:hypothetical protein